MKDFNRRWNTLLELARRMHGEEEFDVAPPGFATRVVANWASAAARLEGSIWEWLAVRGLAVACILTIVAAVASWQGTKNDQPDELASLADPLASEVWAP